MSPTKKQRGRSNATGRNTTERFVAMPHYMLRAVAWKTLSPNAKALLVEVWARHNGMNNGEISYAVREAEEIGLSKDRTARAFLELTARGFLKVRKLSTFNLKSKEARCWEVTAERYQENPPTKDFMSWSAGAEEQASKNKTRSHQRDAQSHQCDTPPLRATKLPVSVAPARP